MTRFWLPLVLFVLAVVALIANVPVFHATGSATYSFSMILLSALFAIVAVGMALWRAVRG